MVRGGSNKGRHGLDHTGLDSARGQCGISLCGGPGYVDCRDILVENAIGVGVALTGSRRRWPFQFTIGFVDGTGDVVDEQTARFRHCPED